jgi:hypothetical protein
MDFTSTEQTVAWFKDRYAEGTLFLKPPYQRNPVWMARQKCYLVESILKQLPIPEVFVQRVTDEEGTTRYAVVDGQQRIRALLQFVGADDTSDQQEFDKFSLDKLDTTSPWYEYAFSDLQPEHKRRFYGYEIAVRYLNSDDDDEMKEMFTRLNRYTSPLKPQELRNATYAGPFAALANKLAEDHSDFLAENRIVTVGAIRRMADVELMAELVIGILHGPQAGNAGTIDEYYQEYEDFEDEFPSQRRAVKRFEDTLASVQRIFADLRSVRWGNKSDFYSLFVAVAHTLPLGPISDHRAAILRGALSEFALEVDERLADDAVPASRDVSTYVRNVQRAPNEKSRRAARHAALLSLIQATLQEDTAPL